MFSIFCFFISILSVFFVKSKFIKILATIFAFLFLIVTLINYSMLNYTGNFLNVYTFWLIAGSIKDAPIMEFWRIGFISVAFIVLILLFCFIYYRKISISNKYFKFSWFVFFVFGILAIWFNPLSKSVYQIWLFNNPQYHSGLRAKLQNLLKEPKISPEFKGSKNIVHIYLESYTRNFMTDYPETSSNLNSFDNAIDFTNFYQPFGGAIVTIEGIHAAECGLPFSFFKHDKYDKEGNFSYKTTGIKFSKDMLCVSRLLKERGYYTSFMKSGFLEFQRLNEFLEVQKFDEVKGDREIVAIRNGGIAKKEFVNQWGVNDDEMFDEAYKDFERFSKSGKPFYQILLNIGMHIPGGYLSKSCENLNYANEMDMLRAVQCTDYLLGEFVNKIRKSPWSKDTIIVIQSDHRMPNGLTKLKDDERLNSGGLVFMILDDDINGRIENNTPGVTMDIGATILGYIGALDELNLGRNIFKKESTAHLSNSQRIYDTAMFALDDLKYNDKRHKSDEIVE